MVRIAQIDQQYNLTCAYGPAGLADEKKGYFECEAVISADGFLGSLMANIGVASRPK